MCFWVSLSNMLTFLQQGSDMVQWLKLPLGFFNDRVAVFCIFVLLEGAVRRGDVSKVLLSRQHLQTNSMVLRQQMGKHDD